MTDDLARMRARIRDSQAKTDQRHRWWISCWIFTGLGAALAACLALFLWNLW